MNYTPRGEDDRLAYDTDQLRAKTGVGKTTIFAEIAAGRLKARRLGRKILRPSRLPAPVSRPPRRRPRSSMSPENGSGAAICARDGNPLRDVVSLPARDSNGNTAPLHIVQAAYLARRFCLPESHARLVASFYFGGAAQ